MLGAFFQGIEPAIGKLRFGAADVARLYYGAEQVWPMGLAIDIEAGSYTLAGQEVQFQRSRNLVVDLGSYVLTGVPASASRVWSVEAGAYMLTGLDATLASTNKLAADRGIYALTGQDAELRSRRVSADAGVFALQGRAANLLHAHLLFAETGAFVITGANAQLGKTLLMSVDLGAYALTGQTAATLRGLSVVAAMGSFTLTGRAAGILATRKVTADQGSYGLAGVAANLRPLRNVVAASGSYGVTGQAADLVKTVPFPAVLGVTGDNRGTGRGTSSSVALPSGSVSGDRTIIAFSTENGASITTPPGWTDIGVQVSFGTYRYKVFYADSIGAGPVSVTHANARASWVCIRLGNVHASAPETATSVVGTNVSPDGPSVTASWGAANNLALSIAAFGLGTISGQTFSASPAGYTTEVTELGASGQSGTVMRIASLQTPLATENPGAFSIGGATNWVADTILIRPA